MTLGSKGEALHGVLHGGAGEMSSVAQTPAALSVTIRLLRDRTRLESALVYVQ